MTDDQFFIDNELRISCADAIELVTDYLDGALIDDDLQRFTTHLESCEGCRVYVDQVDKTIRITSTSRDHGVALTPSNFDQIVTAFEQRRSEP